MGREREHWLLLFGLVNKGGRNTNHLSSRSFIQREREEEEREKEKEREREKVKQKG